MHGEAPPSSSVVPVSEKQAGGRTRLDGDGVDKVVAVELPGQGQLALGQRQLVLAHVSNVPRPWP